MRKINYIYIHCSAGHADLGGVKSFWHRPKSQGGLGWIIGGYHVWVDYDGRQTDVYPLSQITNGVYGHNEDAVHISYRGGVLKDNVHKAADTRTKEQKAGLMTAINDVLRELKKHQPIDHIKILGHRDASPDQNGNGVIEPWERIKECPSFDAIDAYQWMWGKKAVESKTIL